MSRNIRKVSNFLKLLLHTTKEQAKALFYTLTPVQTLVICEIVFNIQHLSIARKAVSEIQKRSSLFNKLGDKTLSTRNKLALIQTHYKQVQSILQLIKSDVISLLE